MKTAFFVRDWEESYIRSKFPEGDYVVFPGKFTKSNISDVKDFDIISVFVDSKVDDAMLAELPNLKMIGTRSTGYDHFDVAALKARGIPATYVPGYGDNTVAEFAFGLLLGLTRKILLGAERVASGSFSQESLEGTDLKGKTAGVIGTGRIGKEFIKMAKGFGMQVVAYDAFPDEKYAAEMGYAYLRLEELLKTAEIISIHCLYNESTHHLLNSGNMPLMKKGSYLINTARGPIVETAAILQALEDGVLAGAGLDVVEEEAYFKNERQPISGDVLDETRLRLVHDIEELIAHPKTIVTPHVAFDSREAHERILDISIDNIRSFISGTPKNLIP